MKDLTKYEYDEQVQRMTDTLKDAAGWGDGFDSSMGQTLIQLVADITDNLHFMLERRTIEGHLITARLRSSKIAAASSLGYRVRRAIANTGTLQVTLKDANGDPRTALADVIVPKFTVISSNGINYVLSQDLVIPVGDSTAFVEVKQGNFVTSELDVTDTNFVNSDFFLIQDYENIDNDVIKVAENGTEYLDIRKNTDSSPARRALSFVGSNDNFYDIRYAVNGMRIVFGNNVFGRKPSTNVFFSYLEIDPDTEELITVGNEFDLGDNLTDTLGNVYDYTAINSAPVRGGQAAESDVELVENALAYFKSNMRCVSDEDWDYWAYEARVGNIVDIKSAGEYQLESIVYNMNNVFLTYLTSDGLDLSVEEQQRLRNYLQPLKMTTSHIVLHKAQELLAQYNIIVKRDAALPISDAELYTLIRRFFTEYFELGKNSIGGKYELTDIIRDLYTLKTTRNGITYNVVDYLKLNMNALYPFTVPTNTNNVIVSLDGYTVNDGDTFGLIIDETPVGVAIVGADSIYSVLDKMKDQIVANFNLVASVELLGASIDVNGNPIPLDVNDDNVFAPIKVISLDPDVIIQHNYYTGIAGRRELIPLGANTNVVYTAPTDTDVNVYVRSVVTDPNTETLFTTILAGQTFNQTFTNGDKSLQFELVNQSDEISSALITYPAGAGLTLGIRITSLDGFGEFSIDPSLGDLTAETQISYVLNIPVKTRSSEASSENILPASTQIIDDLGNIVYTSNTDGLFFDTDGIVAGGRVNHQTGQVNLPPLVDGNYYVKFSQDKYQNIGTDRFAAVRLLEPKATITSTDFSLSTIEVE